MVNIFMEISILHQNKVKKTKINLYLKKIILEKANTQKINNILLIRLFFNFI